MPKTAAPRLSFQPDVYQGLQRGINLVASAIHPTLGPLPRSVVVERAARTMQPEILDDGALIARRVIDLHDATDNAGAMLLRHTLWKLHETVGDSTATAAVIMQALFNDGVRYVTSGGNAMQVRRHLEAGARWVEDALAQQVVPVQGRAMLERLIVSMSHDAELASVLADAFDVLGPWGTLKIEKGHAARLISEYLDGAYWDSGLQTEIMLRSKVNARRTLHNALVLVSDFALSDPHDLVPLMKVAIRPDVQGLVIVCDKLSDNLATLLKANERPGQFEIIAVRIPGMTEVQHQEGLNDIAAACGARVLRAAAGDRPQAVAFEDLGQARRIWADAGHFGIVSGRGSVQRKRAHIDALRARAETVDDLAEQKALQKRVGRLLGGSVAVGVGGATDSEAKARVAVAERSAAATRGALLSGVLPGGGVALLNCRRILEERAAGATDTDERAAYRMLARALAAPFRTILDNAGYEPGAALAQIGVDDATTGFDVTTGRAVDVLDAGIVDSAASLIAATTSAIRGAALALTIDTFIQRESRPQAQNP